MINFNNYYINFEVLNFDIKIIEEYNKYYIDEFDTNTRCLLSIKVFENYKLLTSAIISVSNDNFIIEDSIIITEKEILIQTLQTLFCLDKYTLNLNWEYIEEDYVFYSLKFIDNYYYLFGFDYQVILDNNGKCLKKNI